MAFSVGNIVKVSENHANTWCANGDPIKSEHCEKYAIIENVSGSDYGLIFIENGIYTAWFNEKDLIFVADGSESLLKGFKELAETKSKLYSCIEWIVDNFSENIPVSSIMTLFKEIGYKSKFEICGEYTILADEWLKFYPLFENIVNGEDFSENVKKVFKEEYQNKYMENCKKLQEKANVIKSWKGQS